MCKRSPVAYGERITQTSTRNRLEAILPRGGFFVECRHRVVDTYSTGETVNADSRFFFTLFRIPRDASSKPLNASAIDLLIVS